MASTPSLVLLQKADRQYITARRLPPDVLDALRPRFYGTLPQFGGDQVQPVMCNLFRVHPATLIGDPMKLRRPWRYLALACRIVTRVPGVSEDL